MATPTIIHMDMDAFFASVEQLDNPALKGKCVVVGGSHRGVVAAASYEARQYGIHSAMPMFQARQRCPHLVVVPPRRSRYAELSRDIMGILRDFSPLVEPISIDEAFVDITGSERLFGPAGETALAIKARIKSQTRLTCSIGVAPVKFLAKIASDMDKPDGLFLIPPEEVPGFIETLSIGKVPGVGSRTQQILDGLGIQTLGQVNQFPRKQLVQRLGKFGYRLAALAVGRDDSPVVPETEAKSMSSELTLASDTLDKNVLATFLLDQSQTVARELRRHAVRARTVTLKLKTVDFQQHTRNRTLSPPVQSSDRIYRTAVELLDAFGLKQPVRLIGVGAGNLVSETMPVQQDLFADNESLHHHQWEKVDRALDAISDRYGHNAIKRGSLTEK